MNAQPTRKLFWLTALGVSGWYFALRLAGLTALPIFSDEATYLRWGQLIRRSPLQNAFVSLGDTPHHPPLPSWLLALAGSLCGDPLLAGRLVSVFVGFITLLATGGLCMELNHWRSKHPNGKDSPHMLALLTVLFTLFTPYIAFNQRMALVDPIFLSISAAAAWMSLRARRLLDGRLGPACGLLQVSLPLGLIMAAALLTRQGVSYTLWLLPMLALFMGRKSGGSPRRGVASLWLAVSVIIACVLWMPTLFHGIWGALATNWPTIKVRLVYHTDFSRPLSLPERLRQIRNNLITGFVPTANGQLTIKDIHRGLTREASTGWYWFYLTPPVFILSWMALVYLAIRREWRVLTFLICYLAAMTAPFVLVGTKLYSRYLLYGVIPLLVALGWMIADGLRWGSNFIKTERARVLCGIGIVGVLLVPSAKQILLQDFEPGRQTMTTDDRMQHLTGWAGGYASMRAVQYVKDLARKQPVVLITTQAWGLPHDALWLYLDRYPNVQVYYIDWFGKQPVLNEVAPGQYRLRRDKWLLQPPPPEPVTISPDAAILFAADPYPSADEIEKTIRRLDQVIGEPVRFYNNEFVGISAPGDGATLYRLRQPTLVTTTSASSSSTPLPTQTIGTFQFTSGWYEIERSGQDWLCWTDGRGRLSIVVSNDLMATLTGQILAALRPSDVDILINGAKLASARVDWTNWEFRSFPPVVLPLKAGENTLEFASHQPPVRISTDNRALAVAIRNLNLTAPAN
jgi:4-amino-4-deoxy-L-arabinose transferase-like glycosyltransferase